MTVPGAVKVLVLKPVWSATRRTPSGRSRIKPCSALNRSLIAATGSLPSLSSTLLEPTASPLA